MEFSAQQIADFLKGEIIGDKDVKVSDVSKIESGKPGTLTFLSNPKYTSFIYTTEADITLVNKDFVPEKPLKTTLIKVDNAYQALAKLLVLVEESKPKKTGVDSSAYIDLSAQIGDLAYVGAMAYVGADVKTGEGCKIYPQVYVGDRVRMGDNVTIYAGAKIYSDTVIGNHCVIHSGAVIGADGFGFAPNAAGEYDRIPQIGNVVLEDYVDIGANTCIDCATMGSTVIKRGTKLDNLIQIAHNVEIGENTVIAAQSGIAGSTKIGRNCMLGGQVGVAGHLSVPDKTSFAAQTGISRSIDQPGVYQGAPAIPIMQFNRSYAIFKRLPEMQLTIAELKKEIERLKNQIQINTEK